MAPRYYKAFTLVEVLVVIVIISMLVALLLPAIAGARARARRASCLNNQSQVAKAILQHESAKGHFPGYVNQLGKAITTKLGLKAGDSLASQGNLSWVTMILEPLGHADLWKEWRVRPATPAAADARIVALSEVVCPSDLLKVGQPGKLSFVVNCGISDFGDDVAKYPTDLNIYDPAWGLFFNHNGAPKSTIGADGIADGASQTLMLSENLNATNWATGVAQSDVGMLWWFTASTYPWSSRLEAASVNSPLDPAVVTQNPRLYARPSSNHPGGANAIYADGHGEFLSERMDYGVFCDMMISNQSRAKTLLTP